MPEPAAPPSNILDLWPTVAAARAAFVEAISGVSEADALRPRADEPGGWCVLQVATHVLEWTRNVDTVITSTASGSTFPKHPRGYLPPEAPRTLAEARRALIEASARFLALPGRLPEHPDAGVTVAHEVFGELNYLGWFARCAAHDGDHTRQVHGILESL